MGVLARLRSLGGESRGTALIEASLLMPLLVSLMCGLAEFGQILRQYHLMEKGVRDAARFMSHAEATPCPADADWTTAVGQAKTLAITGKTTGSAPLHRTWTSPDTVQVAVACIDNTAGAWRGGDTVAVVTVTATAPYVDLGMLSFLGITPPTLTVAHQQFVVGGD